MFFFLLQYFINFFYQCSIKFYILDVYIINSCLLFLYFVRNSEISNKSTKTKDMANLILKIHSIFFCILTLSFIQVNAQVCDVAPAQSTLNLTSLQPSTCVRQLINDLTPTSGDGILEVNVNFWVFVPAYTSSLTSVWTHSINPTTSVDAQFCLDVANSTFSNIPSTPQLTVPGVGTPYAKIKLLLKNFTYVPSNLAYLDVANAAYGTFGYGSWFDPNAINVFLGTKSSTNIATGPSGTYIATTYIPGDPIGAVEVLGDPSTQKNVIFFNPEFHFNISSDGDRYDNIHDYGGTLTHEVCHVLGLNHSTGPTSTYSACCKNDPYSFILPTFGCCDFQECNDYIMESYPCSSFTTPCTKVIPQQPCNTQGYSDNLMSQNSGCNRYLSPQQLGVMHFNLRTILKSFLTPSSASTVFTANTALDVDINSDETWASDRYFKGSVTVKAGRTLRVKCTVAMMEGAKIKVEKTAQLILDGGHITNIDGKIWEGVEIVGNPTLPQFQSHPTNLGANLYQGMLRMINGAKISNAKIGARNHTGSGLNAGGVIIANNSYFENNLIDVEFNTLTTFSAPYASASRFNNTQFITTGYIGNNQTPITHARLIKTDGVQFLGCTFQFTPTTYNSSGNGITSTDAIFVVNNFGAYPSVFEGLMKGVFVNNINPLKVPVISNTKFISPKACAAYFMNANYLSFKTNTVQFHPTTYVQQAGVYLNNCKYYKIIGNQFIKTNTITPADPGISIYKSQAGSHEVYHNIFSNMLMGINCMDDNSGISNTIDGLKMNCNIFNSAQPNTYDIALTYTTGLAAPSVMKTQGRINSPTNLEVVRNIYGASCGNQNKWYISSMSNKAIDHGSNSSSVTAITQPTPQPLCSNGLLSVSDASITLNYTTDCPLNPLSSGGGGTSSAQQLANLNNYITDMKSDNGSGKYNAEIQSSVASKLNLFLTDTLGPVVDSIITILNENHGNMQDADVQVVFANMLNYDFEQATTKANALQSTKPNWKVLLNKIIELESDTVSGIFLLNTDSGKRNYLLDHANTNNIDGQSIALAILKAACDSSYSEPHALPEEEEGKPSRSDDESITGLTNILTTNSKGLISIYPNPTDKSLTLFADLNFKFTLEYKLTDLLGKQVLRGSLTPGLKQQLDIEPLSNGVYIIHFTERTQLISKQKVIILKK